MIKSQFKTFGFWLILFMMIFMLFLFVSVFSQQFLNFTIIKMHMPTGKANFFQFILLMSCTVFLVSQLWRDAKLVTVDTVNKTITFQNFFTRMTRIYKLNDFDGFIDMYQSSKLTRYRVIYLVNDKKYIEKISGFYYSNLDELREALKSVKYLGQQQHNFFKSIKVLFNKQIL